MCTSRAFSPNATWPPPFVINQALSCHICWSLLAVPHESMTHFLALCEVFRPFNSDHYNGAMLQMALMMEVFTALLSWGWQAAGIRGCGGEVMRAAGYLGCVWVHKLLGNGGKLSSWQGEVVCEPWLVPLLDSNSLSLFFSLVVPLCCAASSRSH